MNTRIATQHKERMFRLIDDAGQTVTVRTPGVRTTSANITQKIFGAAEYETAYGEPVEVTAWVHQGRVPSGFNFAGTPDPASALGMVIESDLILSVKLEDCLEDAEKVYGKTIFDTARDVQISGSTFEVKGVFRSGFAPLGPYILWVGLVNSGE